MMGTEPGGIYLHVPFCLGKCPYCDFYSVPVSPQKLAAYTRAVCRNLKALGKGQAVDTLYFGGGTPSLLAPEQVAEILEAAATHFALCPDAEITLEANPATLSPGALTALRKAGVNRLSIGVQSLSDDALLTLGRRHTAAQAIEAVQQAAAAGFKNISCDVMLATPGQTAEALGETLDKLAALPIQHISAYLLKVEPGTPFWEQDILSQCPDGDEAAERYLQTVAALEDAGFLQYEISNFAKPGYESRHNCKYWRCVPYLGIGPGAHSCWDGVRFSVPANLEDFLTSPTQTMELEDAHPCTREERMMLGLRLCEGIPATWLSGRKGQVQRLFQAGYLRRNGENIAMTPEGFLVSNGILAEIL